MFIFEKNKAMGRRKLTPEEKIASAEKRRIKRKECQRQYYLNNIEKRKEYDKQHYVNNIEQKKEYSKQHYLDNIEQKKEYYKKNVARIISYNKQYRQDNAEHYKQYRQDNAEHYKQYRQDNAERKRENNLKYNHNIFLVEYNEKFITQSGCCEICGKHQSEFKEALAWDHNHETGKARGILCFICNWQLGGYEHGRVFKDRKKCEMYDDYLKKYES
jgi:hypothetical protein